MDDALLRSLYGRLSRYQSQGFLTAVMLGQVPGHSLTNKFGRNPSAPANILTPVTISGNWQTPTTAQSLELVTSSTEDNILGTGARVVQVIGVDEDCNEISENVFCDGTNPVALSNTYLRVYRAKVIESGSYATQTTASHAGTITIRGAGAGADWLTIDEVVSGFGAGQSQVGCYVIPAGYTGLLLSKHISVDALKTASAYFFIRENIDQLSPAYSGLNLKQQHDGISGINTIKPQGPLLVMPEKTECGFMVLASVVNTSISVDFQILKIANEYL